VKEKPTLRFKARLAKKTEKCKECGFCEAYVCPSPGSCIGCGACFDACPYEAVKLEDVWREETVTIKVDGENFQVPAGITILEALKFLGYKASSLPWEGDIYAPCGVGGCWSCAVLVDGELKPSCVTPVTSGAEIWTKLPENYKPLRIVHGFMGHPVGGVGTPWRIKNMKKCIEAACFACGCNLRCPQCQNWTTTYCGKEKPETPEIIARIMVSLGRKLGVNRLAISGGESTLNRKWLLQYVQEVRHLSSDVRIHVDTNATLLTRDYVDELVEAGMTDIGPDIKGLKVETFMKITGIKSRELAGKLLENSWKTVEYLVNQYKGKVFIGVGLPYNPDLVSLAEIAEMGEKIYKLDSEIQVCLLDYRPEFRRQNIRRPTYREMMTAWKTLKNVGLKTVIAQTLRGHIGP
jgi:pyruvate formate lyase activating enzyme